MIWFDSWLGEIPEQHRQNVVAHHYNAATTNGQEPIAFDKHGALPDSVALKDIEQGGKEEMSEQYWLTDITLSLEGGWCYTEGQTYKKSSMVIRNMIDVWSKKA